MPNPTFVQSFKHDSSLLPSGKGVRVILKSGHVLLINLSRGTMRPLTSDPSPNRPEGVLQLRKGEWIEGFHNVAGSDLIIFLALTRRSSRLLALDARTGRMKWSKKLTLPRELTAPWRTQGKRTQMPMARFHMVVGGDAPLPEPLDLKVCLMTLDGVCVIAWQSSGTQTSVLRGGKVIHPAAFGCRCVLRAVDSAAGSTLWQTTLDDALINDVQASYVQRLDGVWRIDSADGELEMVVPLKRQARHIHVSDKELLVLCSRGKDLTLIVHRHKAGLKKSREIKLRGVGYSAKIFCVNSRILVSSQCKRTHIVNTTTEEVVTIEVPSYSDGFAFCGDSLFISGRRRLLGFSATTGRPVKGLEATSAAGGYWVDVLDVGLADAFLAVTWGGLLKISREGKVLANITQERDDIGHVLFAERGRVAVADWTTQPGRPPLGFVRV